MADSIADVLLNYTWKDINTTTGIAVGSAITIQNKGPKPIFIWLGASAPSDVTYGIRVYPGDIYSIKASEPKVWVFGTGPILVQQLKKPGRNPGLFHSTNSL